MTDSRLDTRTRRPRISSIKPSLRLFAAALVAGLAACTPAEPPPPPAAKLTLTRTSFDRLPGWREDTHSAVLPALGRSCALLRDLPAERPLGAGGTGGTVGHWRAICAALARVAGGDDAAARRFFEAWFVPYLAADNGDAEGLFTGYYEAQLRGAWRAGGRYRVAIYTRPPDLITADLGRFRPEWRGQSVAGRVIDGRLVPFQTRAEIDGGALAGRGLELLWVDSPVDAFFLHVQGSGRVVMADGEVVRLGYAGRNGHAYVAIGRDLVAQGAIPAEALTMQTIRAWLQANPGAGADLMARNPSYIFFRAVDGDGPIGAQGAVLTPGRSLAVDRRFVPLSVPVWLDTTDPLDPAAPLRRLVIAQDTGSAIEGPVRGDLFWGHGAAAAARAGRMKERGRYYLLLPKAASPEIS